MNKLSDFMKIADAAEYLGVSPNTLRNWETAGKILAHRHPVNGYRPETAGKVLECVRDFRDRLAHHAEHRQMTADSANAAKTETTQAVKEVSAIKKQLK